jgi:hypothetical protein
MVIRNCPDCYLPERVPISFHLNPRLLCTRFFKDSHTSIYIQPNILDRHLLLSCHPYAQSPSRCALQSSLSSLRHRPLALSLLSSLLPWSAAAQPAPATSLLFLSRRAALFVVPSPVSQLPMVLASCSASPSLASQPLADPSFITSTRSQSPPTATALAQALISTPTSAARFLPAMPASPRLARLAT